MKKENNIIKEICGLTDKNEPFVSAVITSSGGSTPRTAGTKMLIRKDGSIIGTIGGGSLEAEVIKRGVSMFDTKCALILDFDLSIENIGTMDMICGGGVRVLIELMEPNDTNRKVFHEAARLYEEKKRYLLVSDISDPKNIRRSIISSPGRAEGDLILSESMIKIFWEEDYAFARSVDMDKKVFLIEPSEPIYSLFIFGAGHVSMPLAGLGSLLGFYTVVIDDREEFANRRRFETADDIMVIESFRNSFDYLEIDDKSFIVIITRGHLYDKRVLSSALETDACYIGMIGSSKKREAIYKKLMEEGVSREALDSVHSPIGLRIGGNTPEEIAVSIAAELIAERGKKRGSY